MKLSNTEIQEIHTILEKYCNSKEARSMKSFCQHGSVSTYEHVMYVTKVCYYLNKRLGLGSNVKSLVIGAFLHDFYLYDWHKNESFNFHGLKHHKIALKNANKYFSLTKKEKNIIKSHMWPLTIFSLPLCKEAVIVCLSDKYCALYETIFKR